MSIGIEIQVKLNAGSVIYAANLKLPSGAPSNEDPFLFRIVPVDDVGIEASAVLEVAIVDEKNIYVGIEPPKQIMDIKGIKDVVQSLKVVVAAGNYNSATRKFLSQNK